ncbi:MAG: hypothetical protein ACLTDC_07580 [Lachnospiraceae bacterium]
MRWKIEAAEFASGTKKKESQEVGYIVADSSAVLPGMIIDHDKNFEDIEVKNLYTIFFYFSGRM